MTTPDAPQGRPRWAAVLPRVAAGAVFVASAIVKLLHANQGVGRFAKLGLPLPAVLAPAVSGVELVAGLMLMAGVHARLAAIPLAVDMLVAVAVSKLPLLTGPGPEPLSAAPTTGLWAFLYQARLDLLLLAFCVSLAVGGPEQAPAGAVVRSPSPPDRPA